MNGLLTLAAEFNPADEFKLNEWVSIHLGPIDMSINKAVVYLAISALVTIFIGVFTMRSRLALMPSKRQTIGEVIYEVAQTQIAEQGLPTRAIGRWFPYVASLFLFIFTMNLVGFVPLPLTGETWHGIPTWGIYAVTSQLSVTLVLALLSVVFSHIEGVRYNGWSHFNFLPSGLPPWSVKTAIPLALMYLLEVISQVFRIISLSVRLYANMLAGHMLILVSIGLLFILSGITFWIVAVVALPIGIAFYIFEVVIVVTIQAFIFAALTAIYIGTAVEPSH
ncbi:MAG TPA: F0F1 ATP synthase subunit A [Gaiellaceae bacterium]